MPVVPYQHCARGVPCISQNFFDLPARNVKTMRLSHAAEFNFLLLVCTQHYDRRPIPSRPEVITGRAAISPKLPNRMIKSLQLNFNGVVRHLKVSIFPNVVEVI